MKKQEKTNHKEEITRLNKITGQVNGVKKMIEEGRSSPDIIIQLQSIRAAVKVVESHILQKYVQYCVEQVFEENSNREQKIQELKKLFDRRPDL